MNAPASFHDLVRAALRQPGLTSDACLLLADALDEIQHPHDASPEGANAREEAREVAEALRALAPLYSATPLPEAPARSVEDTLGTPPASHLWVHLTPPDDGRAYPSAAQVQELLEALRLPRGQLQSLREAAALRRSIAGVATFGRTDAYADLLSIVLALAEELPP
ncbi:hypothetical protein [Roseococcus microcysteis]|uniref:hypothetical protein n=1 Tax=Roseococcus microcysteis TaxID=2771361 RepID=UPI00168B942D|nr:hypothetical protein [Roseococcus microcysteis]